MTKKDKKFDFWEYGHLKPKILLKEMELIS